MRCILATTLSLFFLCFTTTTASADEATYTAMFWNIHSGGSEANTIGDNMAQKGAVDFWGLSEVPSNPAFLATLESKIEAATGVDYTFKCPMSADKTVLRSYLIPNA